MFQAGIETRLTLQQSDILPSIHPHSQRLWGRFFFLMYSFLHTRYQRPVMLNSWEELVPLSLSGSWQIFPQERSAHRREHIYCHPQTDCFVVSQLIYIYIYNFLKLTMLYVDITDILSFLVYIYTHIPPEACAWYARAYEGNNVDIYIASHHRRHG